MKCYFSFISFVILSFSALAQAPDGYYNNAGGLTGNELKTALHDIIDNHTVLSYSELWDAFYTTDLRTDGTIWDIYSDVPGGAPPYTYEPGNDQCGNYSGEGSCYNREHTFPKSWFDDAAPMYTDLFHIYPTDGYVNGRRSNYPYGEVDNASWASENGSEVGPCSFSGYTGTVFEPIDDYKGDLARTYFYMLVRYHGQVADWDSEMLSGGGFSDWALELLAAWHAQDPVSEKEQDRNNAIYSLQQNRNPFIDHPEYVNFIWLGEGYQTYTLHEIQETTAADGASPLAGEYVKVTGTVTASQGPYFSLQNGQGAWNAIQVEYDPATSPVGTIGTGTTMTLTARVREMDGMTTLTAIDNIGVTTSAGNLPAPVSLNIAGARQEKHESVFVHIPDASVVPESLSGQEYWQVSQEGDTLAVSREIINKQIPQEWEGDIWGVMAYSAKENRYTILPFLEGHIGEAPAASVPHQQAKVEMRASRHYFTLKTAHRIKTAQLMDMHGRLLRTFHPAAPSIKIRRKATGMRILHIYTEAGRSASIKIMP